MLTGEYNHQLDAKNRIRIPAKLKKELGEEYYFTKGEGGCISVFPKSTVDAQFEKLNQIKLSETEKQKSLRLFAKSFVSGEEDNQGRVVLNPALKSYAGIKKDLVICGAVNRIEIWAKEVYETYFNDDEIDVGEVYKLLDI